MPPKTTQKDWEPYYNQIQTWYLIGKMSAGQIATKLTSEHNFPVNTRQVQLRLQQWKCNKTNTNQGQIQDSEKAYNDLVQWNLANNSSNSGVDQQAQGER